MSIRSDKKMKRQTKKTLQCYAILSTQLVGLVVFTFYPILWAAQKAFYYYDGTPSNTRFVGLDNFITLFTRDTTYWDTWYNTIVFTVGKLIIELPLALFIAICLSRKLKGTGFFRAMYYLPCVVSVAIVGLTFSSMFDYFGFVNAWLQKTGMIETPISWFSQPMTAMIVLIIGAVWNTFGHNVLYFIAALSNVPKDLYESAKLDGAGTFTIFWKITLPMIAPVFQVILLMAINGTLHTCDYIIATTNGGPFGSTYTVMAYQVGKFAPGFAGQNVNIGYGCAFAVVTSILMMIIALIYGKLTKKLQNIY